MIYIGCEPLFTYSRRRLKLDLSIAEAVITSFEGHPWVISDLVSKLRQEGGFPTDVNRPQFGFSHYSSCRVVIT